MGEQGIYIAAVIGVCLIVCILALAAVSTALAFIVYRRFGQTEQEIAHDMAGRMLEYWQAGSNTRRDMVRDIEGETSIEAETRVRRQHFKQPQDRLRHVMQEPDEVEIATFGDVPIMPEMQTQGA